MNSHKRRIINAMAIPLIALGSLAASMIPAQAALGTVLRNSDTGLQGNGRGLAFDGQDLYYTLLGDSNIYRNSTSGGGGSLLGTIGLPFGDPRVMTGGPLAWDGTALWTADYSAALILYRVDPVSGATIGSCDLNAVNPGHPALSGLANPDGMDYDGSTNSIILSGARSPYLAAQANNVAIIDAASCRIASWFVATIGPGGWGTAGVTIDADGTHLWHATSSGPGGAGNHFYQTDFAGVPNGVSFTATVFPPGTPPISPMDMATDINTFSPTCVIWAHEGNGLPIVTTAPPIIKKEHFTAYEVPCPGINHPPACDAGHHRDAFRAIGD